jgi:hypothetical protein
MLGPFLYGAKALLHSINKFFVLQVTTKTPQKNKGNVMIEKTGQNWCCRAMAKSPHLHGVIFVTAGLETPCTCQLWLFISGW